MTKSSTFHKIIERLALDKLIIAEEKYYQRKLRRMALWGMFGKRRDCYEKT